MRRRFDSVVTLDDFPDPDTSVKTTRGSRGISTSMFLRLGSRAVAYVHHPARAFSCSSAGISIVAVCHVALSRLGAREIRRVSGLLLHSGEICPKRALLHRGVMPDKKTAPAWLEQAGNS